MTSQPAGGDTRQLRVAPSPQTAITDERVRELAALYGQQMHAQATQIESLQQRIADLEHEVERMKAAANVLAGGAAADEVFVRPVFRVIRGGRKGGMGSPTAMGCVLVLAAAGALLFARVAVLVEPVAVPVAAASVQHHNRRRDQALQATQGLSAQLSSRSSMPHAPTY